MLSAAGRLLTDPRCGDRIFLLPCDPKIIIPGAATVPAISFFAINILLLSLAIANNAASK